MEKVKKNGSGETWMKSRSTVEPRSKGPARKGKSVYKGKCFKVSLVIFLFISILVIREFHSMGKKLAGPVKSLE